jgi:hypothetical protein
MGDCSAVKSDQLILNGVLRGRGRAPGALSHMVAANLRAPLAARMGIYRGVNLRVLAVRRTRLSAPEILR